MPPLLHARPPADPDEQRTLRRLAASRHAPADWILRARIVVRSWDGERASQIAAGLGCHPKTVRQWLHRFNTHGVDGLGDRPRSGRPRRLDQTERASWSPWSARTRPAGWSGRPTAPGCGRPPAARCVDAGCAGPGGPRAGDRRRAQPGRSHPAGGGGTLAAPALLTARSDQSSSPKGPRHRPRYPPADRVTVVCADELGPVSRGRSHRHRAGRLMPPGQGATGAQPRSEKTWVGGGLRVADGQTATCTAPSRNSAHSQRLLWLVEQANPTGEVVVTTDNLSSHPSVATREWLADHPRLQQVLIPRGRAR
jgi:hypothetical protein